MSEKVIVAGAGFLGVSTALKLERKGFDVKLIDKKGNHEYIPGLINIFRDRIDEENLRLELDDFFENTGVKFSIEKIEDIRPDENLVETDQSEHRYDYLVLAMGGEPATYGIDISEAEHCYNLRAAIKLGNRIKEAEKISIVGSGYVGIELVGELSEKDLEVDLIEANTEPMPRSNDKASRIAWKYITEHDINFKGGRRVKEISEKEIKFENGDPLETDLVVWSGGVQASEKVQECFDTGPDGLPVNPGLCSKEYENIFAGGDCAEADYLKTAHNAMSQAETIAENIGKEPHEDLRGFESGDTLVVSMGKTGVMLRGEKAYKNILFRYLKDLIRLRYWFVLRKERLKNRISRLF